MSKFIFVRHGEAVHNVAFHDANNNPEIFLKEEYADAPLTEKGKKQVQETAIELAEKYPNVEAIWCSPLTRCIETADEIFEETSADGYYVHDNLMERQRYDYHFNVRKDKRNLKKKYGHINYDYIPEYPAFWGIGENNYSLRTRMHMMFLFLLNLYKDSNGVVIIVGHSDAFFTLTGKNLKNAEYVELTRKEIEEL